MGSPSRVRVTGPLEPYAAGFASELARVGYTEHSTSHQLRVFAHLSRWLAAESLDVAELTPVVGDAFLIARRAAGYTLWLSRKALQPLFGTSKTVASLTVRNGERQLVAVHKMTKPAGYIELHLVRAVVTKSE